MEQKKFIKSIRDIADFEALKVDIKTLKAVGEYVVKFSKRYEKLLNDNI